MRFSHPGASVKLKRRTELSGIESIPKFSLPEPRPSRRIESSDFKQGDRVLSSQITGIWLIPTDAEGRIRRLGDPIEKSSQSVVSEQAFKACEIR